MTSPSVSLTVRQRDLLRAIRLRHEELGYPPSVRELADDLGLRSSSSVHAHLRTLTDLGLVERGRPGTPRTLRVVRDDLPRQVPEP